MFGSAPSDVTGYCEVPVCIQDHTKVVVSASSTASERNARGIVLELTLEDLEGSIGRFAKNLGKFSVWESRKSCIRHSITVLALYEDSETVMNGANGSRYEDLIC
jgi:hypothetical protein